MPIRPCGSHHPRGRDGRFIEKYSADALTHTQQRISESLDPNHVPTTGRTSDDVRNLLDHFNLLDDTQVNTLLDEHAVAPDQAPSRVPHDSLIQKIAYQVDGEASENGVESETLETDAVPTKSATQPSDEPSQLPPPPRKVLSKEEQIESQVLEIIDDTGDDPQLIAHEAARILQRKVEYSKEIVDRLMKEAQRQRQLQGDSGLAANYWVWARFQEEGLRLTGNGLNVGTEARIGVASGSQVAPSVAAVVLPWPFKAGIFGKPPLEVKKPWPKEWKEMPVNSGRGWKLVDEKGIERVRYMRPNKSGWFYHEKEGYYRFKNEKGEFLDEYGKVVKQDDPAFDNKTHIPRTSIKK